MTAQGEAVLAWLESAIRERERVASDAAAEAGGEWREDPFVYGVRDQKNALVAKSREDRARSIVHIAAADPASVLRRCAADRKLLGLHGGRAHSCPVWDDDGDFDQRVDFYDHEICPAVQFIAQGYGWTGGER
ncbi:hypothetical protein D0Z67_29465 (plasmid) [Streptomyces seoulensis]|uniref:Uncharacterized protein n=1 Tax=Streptomyces seoulensis TaxID=73044 RepID=A0A4P6U365_STRSO|nr:DUF6221 family protein [Streptomyces seoulensis]QBJ94499.1 hypothetical protein D0Z67_29465 [Streptomyces seoulensis]